MTRLEPNLFEALVARIKRLPVNMTELGLDMELTLFQDSVERGRPDTHLYAIIDSRLAELEESLLRCPFMEPDLAAGLENGEIQIASTAVGQPVRISLTAGAPNEITHFICGGTTGSGKSCQAAVVASGAARSCATFVIDSTRFFRNIPDMHERHNFARVEHLRLNLWDVPDGVSANQVDQIVNKEICESFGLKFAEYELSEVVRRMRERRTPCLPEIVRGLEQKQYQGYSKRGQYRDSALLVLGNLLHATGDLFRCSKGMDLEHLISGNVVLEVDGLLPDHQAFLVRYIFEFIHLLTLRHDDG